MKRYFLSILTVFSLFFCRNLSANVVFPIMAFFLRANLWFGGGLIFFSLIIEYFVLRYFLPKTVPSMDIAFVTVIMNIVSGFVGAVLGLVMAEDFVIAVLMYPLMIFFEHTTVTASIINTILAVVYLLLFFIIAVSLNVLIEFPVARSAFNFSDVKNTKLIKYLFIGNCLSMALAMVVLFILRPIFGIDKSFWPEILKYTRG